MTQRRGFSSDQLARPAQLVKTGSQRRQNFLDTGNLLEKRGVPRAYESSGGCVADKREQRLPIALAVENNHRTIVQLKLFPGQNFKRFIKSPKPTGQHNERLGAVDHHPLALMHRGYDVKFRQRLVRDFHLFYVAGNDTDNFAPGSKGRVRCKPHQTDTAAAIDQPDSAFAEKPAERYRVVAVGLRHIG